MLKLGQQTITGKFTILIALLLIFSMTFLSVVTYTSFSQMVDRKVVQLSENLLALANQDLDYIIADVKDTSNLLLTSSSIQQVLLYAGNDQKVLEYNKSLIEATNLMNNMVNNKTYLSSVYIGNPNLRLTSRKGDHFSLRISQLDYDNPPVWMQKILADKGQAPGSMAEPWSILRASCWFMPGKFSTYIPLRNWESCLLRWTPARWTASLRR